MPDRHALLGPSSSERWLACPPSARLEETFPSVSTVFTEEGTRAHSLAELKLSALLSGVELKRTDEWDDEMWNCTDDYRDFVEEELVALSVKNVGTKLFIEQELDFAEYVPEGFGTSDSVIVSDSILEVIDFKYGKGVAVSAQGNTQLRLYALGAYLALSSLYDFERVKMAIFQPRLHSVTTDEISVAELLDWADNYVKPRAALAFAGEGEFCVGDHCRFCKAGSVCRARAELAFEVVQVSEQDKSLLTDEEIEKVLDKLDATEEWINTIRTYVRDKAVNEGYKWPGFKLVEARTQRKITDQFQALDRLESAGFDREDVTTLKLKGLSELEKIVTKKRFNEMLGDLIEKPKGQLTLVRENDSRPEVNPVEFVFKEE